MNTNIKNLITYGQAGDCDAMIQLSWIYYTGKNVRKSYKKFFYWAAKAALVCDNRIIDYNLSIAYVNGQGVKKNYYKSFLWALRSAKKGHIDAMLAVAWSLFNGIGVAQDFQKAKDWYMKILLESPENTSALFSLGQIDYLNHNYDDAYESFIKAFNINGHARSSYYLGRIFLNKHFNNKSTTKGIHYLEIAAKKNIYEAKRLLISRKIKALY